MTGGLVKVLIVDDAPIVRNVLTKELSRDSRIEVVGAAEEASLTRPTRRNVLRNLMPKQRIPSSGVISTTLRRLCVKEIRLRTH